MIMRDIPIISDLIADFRRIFRLNPFHEKHEAVHVMTGEGPTVPSELYVRAFSDGLLEVPLQDARKQQGILYELIMDVMKGKKSFEKNVTFPLLATDAFIDIQQQVVPLDSSEVESLHGMGRQAGDRIKKMFGKAYDDVHTAIVTHMPFSQMDFVAPVQKAKRQYARPENIRAENAMMQAFHRAASREGRGRDIPAAGAPWHGQHRVPFSGTQTHIAQ